MSVEAMVDTLTKRRVALGMSQRQLDKKIGVSDCMIGKWEAGMRSPTATSLLKWAKALGYRLELLPPGEPRRRQ